MYPINACRPIQYLFDHFDGPPWHCYFGARLTDSGTPANDSGSRYVTRVREPAWTTSGSKLIPPQYTWLTIPAHDRTQDLVVKIKTFTLPFTVQVAWKFATWPPSPYDAPTSLIRNMFSGAEYLGFIQTTSSGYYQYVGSQMTPTANTNGCIFNTSALAAAGDACYFKWQIDADRTAQFDFKVNGTTLTGTSGDWFPTQTRIAPTTYPTNLATYRGEYLPYTLGGKSYYYELDYLEVKIHDHTL